MSLAESFLTTAKDILDDVGKHQANGLAHRSHC